MCLLGSCCREEAGALPRQAVTLTGHHIRLEEVQNGIGAIYFNAVLLARLDERDYAARLRRFGSTPLCKDRSCGTGIDESVTCVPGLFCYPCSRFAQSYGSGLTPWALVEANGGWRRFVLGKLEKVKSAAHTLIADADAWSADKTPATAVSHTAETTTDRSGFVLGFISLMHS